VPELSFWVPGIPQPQGSTRAFRRGAKIVITSDNVNLKPWRLAVTWKAQIERRLPQELMGAVYLDVEFYFPRPKGHFGRNGNLLPSAPARHVTKPDCSKLVRAVEDSLTDAGVWVDDNQVVAIHAIKHYADLRPPGAQITVTPMAQPAATPGDSAHGPAAAGLR
jgi:Holliday junction resolvase RusA-like endonuclease